MWYFFGKRGEEEEIPSELGQPLSCTDVIELASDLDWSDWAIFLTMARNHKIDGMTKSSVEALFRRYKEATTEMRVDACTPRQLTEFLYLLTPERWVVFKQFVTTVDINTLSFPDLLLQYHRFEYEQTRAATAQ